MLLRRYPIFNRRLALVAYGIDYQLSSPAEWPSLAQHCRLLAQGRQYPVPFTHEQLDEQRPLLFDQDVIPLVEASSERLPGSFPVLEQWRDSRRRLAVHGANRNRAGSAPADCWCSGWARRGFASPPSTSGWRSISQPGRISPAARGRGRLLCWRFSRPPGTGQSADQPARHGAGTAESSSLSATRSSPSPMWPACWSRMPRCPASCSPMSTPRL